MSFSVARFQRTYDPKYPKTNKTSDALLLDTPAGAKHYNSKGRLKEEVLRAKPQVDAGGARQTAVLGAAARRYRNPPNASKHSGIFSDTCRCCPSGGEIVMFDRSWYNRSNIEWVMEFCREHQHQEFLRSCPEFERMLVRSGIILVKYWFSISYEEQERRFAARNDEPLKRLKLSDMDLEEHRLYTKYSMAKDTTFQYTDIKEAPWHVVPSDDKRRARLNCISHLLSHIPYEDVTHDSVEIPPSEDIAYIRPPMQEQTFVPLLF